MTLRLIISVTRLVLKNKEPQVCRRRKSVRNLIQANEIILSVGQKMVAATGIEPVTLGL